MAKNEAKIIISAEDKTKQVLDRIQTQFKNLTAISAGAAVAAGAGIFAVAKSAAEFNDQLGKSAASIGTTIEHLSGLKYAAQLADVELEGLSTGLSRLAQSSEDYSDGLSTAVDAFNKLKLDPTQFADTGDLFEAVAEQLSKLPDGTKKTAIAMDLLGRSGAKLIPLMNEGADGIRAAREEAEQFGLIVSTEVAAQSEEFLDNMTRLGDAAEGLKLSVGNLAIPALAEISRAMTEAAKDAGLLKAAWVGLGGLAAHAFGLDFASQQKDKIKDLRAEVQGLERDIRRSTSNGPLKPLNPLSAEEIQAKARKINTLTAEINKLEKALNPPKPDQADKDKGLLGNLPVDSEPKRSGGRGKSQADKDAEAADRFVESLRKQAETADLARSQLIAYEAAQLKLTETQKAYVNTVVADELAKEEAGAADESLTAWIENYTERDKAYQSMADSLKRANEDLNVDLIASDEKRARAQIDLEHQRAVERIRSMELEAGQIDDLLTQEEERYRKTIEKTKLEAKDAKSLSDDLGLVFKSAFEEGIRSGASFSDTLANIGKDIEQLAARRLVLEPLLEAFDQLIKKAKEAAEASASSSGGAGFFGKIFDFVFNANGGVYNSPSLSAYSGKVYNTPQLFKFAHGAGVFSEAGPEAIMPLQRGANGKLGVQADGLGGNVVVNVYGAQGQPEVRKKDDGNGNMTIDLIFDAVKSSLSKDIRSEGTFAQTLQGQYGLNRAAGVR